MSDYAMRSLRAEIDEPLYHRIYQWRKDKPRWFQMSMAPTARSLEEFLSDTFDERQVDFALFIDGEISAVVTLVEIMPGVFDSHIDAPRTAKLSDLTEAVLRTKEHVFARGATKIVTYTATFNRPIIRLCKSVGFVDTNVSVFYGSIGKRIVEWREAIIEKKIAETD